MKLSFTKLTALSLIVALAALLYPVIPAQAAALTDMSDTLSTLKINTDADQEILFTLSAGGGGLASGETIILTWDSDFDTTGVVFTDLDLSYEATPDGVCETGDTEMAIVDGAPVTTSMGFVNTSSTVITLTNGTTAIAAGSEVCIQIGTNAAGPGVNTLKNPTTAASFDLVISGTMGAPDTGTIVITTVTDDVVVTTATVAASLTFSITDVAIGFGTLDTANDRWATADATGTTTPGSAHDISLGTNSTGGYTLTYNGTTLTSTGTPADTISVATITGDPDGTQNSEQFAIGFSTGGSGTITTAYQQASNNFKFVESTTTTVLTLSAAGSETVSAYYLANIASTTEAHTDYTSSITYVATGNF